MPALPGRFRRLSPLDLIACAVPLVLVGGMLLTFYLSPAFYLEYVLEHRAREGQVVELITHLSTLFAAMILFPCALYHFVSMRRGHVRSWFFSGGMMILLVALAAGFFAGEEMSWGQTLFRWHTPETMKAVNHETNIHNNVHVGDFVHVVGNLFNMVMFFAVPLLWAFRDRLKLPAEWAAGVAEWPVPFCILVGSSLRLIKVLYMNLYDKSARSESLFYTQYLEEISEQKEMLIAVALLIYAVYRIPAVVRYRRGLVGASSGSSVGPSSGSSAVVS